MALVPLLILAAVVALGIIGTVAKGLLYLLIIGAVVFLAALLLGALKFRHGARRPTLARTPAACGTTAAG